MNAIGMSLDLYCLNCEYFTLVVLQAGEKAITRVRCCGCGDHMLLIQVFAPQLAADLRKGLEVK